MVDEGGTRENLPNWAKISWLCESTFEREFLRSALEFFLLVFLFLATPAKRLSSTSSFL